MDAIKVFVDGGFSARGAAVLRPYRDARPDDPAAYGRIAYEHSELCSLMRQIDDAGLELLVHANGERAQRAICEAAVESGFATRHRTRLEHAGNFVSDPATVDFWLRADAVPVAQPAFIWSMASFMPTYLGDYASSGLMPFRTLHRRVPWFCFASDAAGSDPRAFRPLFGLQCALARTSCIGEPINPGEALDFMSALRMVTTTSAAAMGLTGTAGTLAAGARADFVVLSRDPSQVPVDRLANLDVLATVVRGEIVRPATESSAA
jgi:hypothetical protein